MARLASLEGTLTSLQRASLSPSVAQSPLEQSTMQQRSDEDNRIQRQPSHQVPTNTSAVDSSDTHPREGAEGQEDGAEHAGSAHHPD